MKARSKAFIKSVINNATAFGRRLTEDSVAAYSGQTTMFIIISFFPFVMFLLTLLQYLPFSQEQLIQVMSDFMPNQVGSYIGLLINEIYEASSGVLLSITIVITLWSASKGILAIYRGLNSVNHITETRNYFHIRIRVMVYTLLFSVSIILLLVIFVFGNKIVELINDRFPYLNFDFLSGFETWRRFTIVFCVLLLVFLIMYRFIPNTEKHMLQELPGAALASAGWVVYSSLYSFYVDNMANMAATYGSLTAVVLCILWLYECMRIFFLGEEINILIQKRRKLRLERKKAHQDSAPADNGATD